MHPGVVLLQVAVIIGIGTLTDTEISAIIGGVFLIVNTILTTLIALALDPRGRKKKRHRTPRPPARQPPQPEADPLPDRRDPGDRRRSDSRPAHDDH